MDARRPTVDSWHELNTWLHACDICVGLATNPVAATCGHFFCSSCLDDAVVDGLAQRNACPICDAELLGETAHNFPIVDSVAYARPPRARRTIVSDAATSAGNNTTMTGPVATTDMRSNLISEARMEVVQNMIDNEIERSHTRQVDLIRHCSNLRGRRIESLERAFETVGHMNEELLREMEDRDEDNRRLHREVEDRDEDNRRLHERIAELENPTARASHSGLRMNSVLHRRFGRRINPTPIATPRH